jgi:hypothetical protein
MQRNFENLKSNLCADADNLTRVSPIMGFFRSLKQSSPPPLDGGLPPAVLPRFLRLLLRLQYCDFWDKRNRDFDCNAA